MPSETLDYSREAPVCAPDAATWLALIAGRAEWLYERYEASGELPTGKDMGELFAWVLRLAQEEDIG